MNLTLKTGNLTSQKSACAIIGIYANRRLSESAKAIDEAANGALVQWLKKGDFEAKAGDTTLLYQIQGTAIPRLLLVGLGEEKSFNVTIYRNACQAAAQALDTAQISEALNSLPTLEIDGVSETRKILEAVIASQSALYRFTQCKSKPEKARSSLKRMGLFIGAQRKMAKLTQAIDHGKAIANGMALARDLGNLPGNICTPGYLADQARALGRRSGKLKVQVLEEKRMQSLGMGALLSVSRGSRQPAKLIVMEYKGGNPKSKPVVLVGKGLTFDAGGISIKPSANMDEMKYDMCGGASVLGTLSACVEAELPINLVGIIPSSENLPDGDANKPGDIVTSMSGQTIEVLNTDAEGRLILCDALTYVERYKPDVVIDIATLTGACIIALGAHASGLLSNNDKLADDLLSAGEQSGDRAWRLPLWDDYQSQLDSNFADMANIGGKGAGTITAACFLSRFTKKYKWAHLDIAGTAWLSGNEKGGTGRPVPLLTQYLLKRCRLGD